MIRFASAVLALALLAGCGASPAAAPKKATSKAAPAAAKSNGAAVAEKGLVGLFTLVHTQADADGDGALNADEYAEAKSEDILPGLPAASTFDKDKDGQVTLAEFTDKAALKGKAAIFTARAAKEFVDLDANKDKALNAAELEDTEMSLASMDADKNKKVSQAEFEAAFAAALSKPTK